MPDPYISPNTGPVAGGTEVVVHANGYDFTGVANYVIVQEFGGWYVVLYNVPVSLDHVGPFRMPATPSGNPANASVGIYLPEGGGGSSAWPSTEYAYTDDLPPAADCIRRAWLEHNGHTLALEDTAGGWACIELNLGWPEVREVVNNRPDASGVDDSQTRYFGARPVSANIQTLAGAAYPDAIAAQFGAWMRPDIRPELHYVLDRPGAPERVLTVRAGEYSWPITGTNKREIHLAWVAADPVARDVLEQSATAWSGSATAPGRTYDLIFPRLYPPGGGSATTAELDNAGDVPVGPMLRLYGPITAPHVRVWSWNPDPAQELASYDLIFAKSFVIGSGQFIDVDCNRHTATLDGASVIGSLDWSASRWPVLHPLPIHNSMTYAGESTAGVTQAVATWHDLYLA